MSDNINNLVIKANRALESFVKLDQEQVDKIVQNMAIKAMENNLELAKLAIQETNRGILEDKIIKNMFASEYVFNNIKNKKTVGIINDNNFEDCIEILEPLGVVAGVTPVTNPSSTVIFKCLICAKTRNPIIFGFHPGAQKTCVKTAEILKQAGLEAGAPEDFIQWIEEPSVKSTSELMNHEKVHIVLATGGSGMVKSAYSTGKPALGVGPGNVPCYIEKTADLERACHDLILSKTFDNGMICASEQSVIVDECISQEFENIMTKNNNIFFKLNNNLENINKLFNIIINPETNLLNSKIVGKSAYEIASMANINIPENTKILFIEQIGVGKDFLLSQEKLSPVLTYYKSKNSQEAFEICKNILNFGGLGHTASIHSNNQEIIKNFGLNMNSCRIIVNSPSSHGAIGDIYNTNTPSLTLGCGSHGKNSSSLNISCENLLNTKKIFFRRNNMQWFKVPPKIYFEKNSISYLQNLNNLKRILIITDKNMVKLKFLDKIIYYLNKNNNIKIEIFDNINPDPDFNTVLEGYKILKNFNPDCIISLGGGSVIDAGKVIWLLSNNNFNINNNINFDNIKLKFMDIRKRICEFPDSHRKIKFVAIPTTSGTGSEVTSFAVITDNSNNKNIKYPLADYNLTPDVSIIDPNLVMSLPKITTADTGMDVLTHAIEAYVSIMASDYTDGLCLQAIELVFKYLVRAYENGEQDSIAREKLHNASCIAGMAFTNAFLGLNHSMAHKIGGEFNISHGRSNAILLPYIIKYNSTLPEKFVSFPKYEKFVADHKYSRISQIINNNFNNNTNIQENIDNLILYIQNLNKKLNIPSSFREYGVPEEEFLLKLDNLSELAHQDQCTSTNPRYPLISDIKSLYLNSYYGNL